MKKPFSCKKPALLFFVLLLVCAVMTGCSRSHTQTPTADEEQYFAKTPQDEIEQKTENEEYVITAAHSKTADGKWTVADTTYAYRLEITGRTEGAAKNTAFLVLSNTPDITFEEALMASPLGSDTNAYFDPKEAVIVGCKLFS